MIPELVPRIRELSSRAALAAALAGTLAALGGCAGKRGTIGALIAQKSDGRLVLREVPAGLAAERAGLRAGDEILLIDGRDVRTMSAEDVHRALSGEVGEPVKLTLVRGDDVVRATLRRSEARKLKVGPRPPASSSP